MLKGTQHMNKITQRDFWRQLQNNELQYSSTNLGDSSLPAGRPGRQIINKRILNKMNYPHLKWRH